MIHIFSYSDRDGTKAARLANKIDKETKKLRSRELHQLAAELKHQELSEQIGSNVEVLWESSSLELEEGLKRYFGYTPNYHKVQLDIKAGFAIERSILPTNIIAVNDNNLLVGQLDDSQINSLPKLKSTNISFKQV